MPAGLRALLAASGIAWLIVEWNNPGAGAAFSAGLVLHAAWPPLLAHAALRHGGRPLSRPAIALLAVAYADSLLVLGAGFAALLRPGRAGLPRLPREPPAAGRAPAGGARPRARRAARRRSVVGGVHRARAGPAGARDAGPPADGAARPAPRRRGRRAVRSPRAARRRARLPLQRPDRSRAVGRHRSPRWCWSQRASRGRACERAACAAGSPRLVVDLGQSPPPGGLRDQLARAFGDPSLELLHARDDEAGWVDGDGRPADIPHDPGRRRHATAGWRPRALGARAPPRPARRARAGRRACRRRAPGARA